MDTPRCPHATRYKSLDFFGAKSAKVKGCKTFLAVDALATVCRRSVALHGCPAQGRSEACAGCALHKGPGLLRYRSSCRYSNLITDSKIQYFVKWLQNNIHTFYYHTLKQSNYIEVLTRAPENSPGLLLFSLFLPFSPCHCLSVYLLNNSLQIPLKYSSSSSLLFIN